MNFGLEAKVGAFVLVCFALIAFMSLKVGSFSVGGEKGIVITAYLDNAGGLTADSSVMFNGVEVGKVLEIKLEKGKPIATLLIDEQYELPDNIMVVVRSSGFLGEKFADLQMTDTEPMGSIKNDVVITNSKTTTDFDELGNKLGDVADDVKQITQALKEVLATAEAKDNMKMTLENVRYTTDAIRQIVADNERRVNAIMANVETLTDSLNKITVANQQNINDIVSNILVVTQELKRQTPSIAHSLDNVTGNIDDIVGGGKEDISDTIKNLRAVTAKLETTVDNMNDITGQIKKGDGTIGKLVYDNSTVDNINNTLTSLQSSLGKLDKLRVDLSFHGERLFDTNENQGFFRLKLTPNEKRYYLLGLETHPDGRTETTDTHKKRDYTSGGTDFEYYQTEDETKDDLTFTAMYAHRFFDDLYFRIGLEESEFGVGVDYFPFETKNFELNLDVYDFPDKDEDRDAKVKAMAKYKFFENFFITGGVADIANDDTRSVFIGGGVEFNDDDLKYLLGSVPMPK